MKSMTVYGQSLISVVPAEVFPDAREPDSYQESQLPLLRVGVLSYREVNSNNNHGCHLLSVYYVLRALLSALCITLSQLILTLTEFANQWLGGQIQASDMFCLAHMYWLI